MRGAGIPAAAGAALRYLHASFEKAGVETPDLDARLLVEWATGANRLAVLAYPDRLLSVDERIQLSAALERRLAHEPVHRIIGKRGFYGLDFALSPDTLEPRPDTECLIDLVLKHSAPRYGAPLSVIDLGAGAGIIAITLLCALPNARAVATDISAGALATASSNAAANGVSARFSAVQGDWLGAAEGRFDLIVSNPPYIASRVISALSPEVRKYDPALALDGGSDGLDAYRSISSSCMSHMNPNGMLAVEIGFDQRLSVQRLFEEAGLSLLEAARDLGGNDRALIFHIPSAAK